MYFSAIINFNRPILKRGINIKIIVICALCAIVNLIAAQAVCTLNNPSFEDEPADAMVPMGWFACAQGTTPDILPGFWGVYDDPFEGDSFVGLITRENGTYESIGQRLPNSLSANACYSLNISLSHSAIYAGYDNSIRLRIWGSENKCDKQFLIYESKLIEKLEWQQFKIEFAPDIDLNYIKLEAFISEKKFSHKGNILIDNISPIIKCKRA